MTTLETGDSLDHFRIDATVARSGMATIYRATDLRDNSRVAIKVPHPEMEGDPVLSDRFRREQDIGLMADHPGVMKVLENDDASRVYMVMEWVEGKLLRALMNEERQLPIERAVTIAARICDALEYLHKHGIVHRDLKPENIMIGKQDNIKLIDFGIAMREDARRITFVTISQTLGTPDYISPEQVQGKRGDARSDLYSLGIILYEMLTGAVPFSGANPFTVMNARVINDAPAARKLRPEISPALQETLKRALERDPHHRYSTAHEFQWDLEHPDQMGFEPRHSSSGEATRKTRGKIFSPKTLLYAGVALLPIVLFLVMIVLSRQR